MNSTKKGISPVVATALLLVTAVASVVAFTAWYNQFGSDLVVDVEEKDTVGSTRIETSDGANLYFNVDVDNITIVSVTVDSTDCEVNGTYARGVQTFSLANCSSAINEKEEEFVVVTNIGVFSQDVFFSFNPN